MKPVTAAPPEKREAALAAPVDEHPLRRVALGWRASCTWVGFICIWYLALQTSLSSFVPNDPEARHSLLQIVPLHIYRYSEAAFAVATVLNLLNMIFEETPNKQQLGMLSAVIKGLSWHADHFIVSGRAVIKFDYHGALLIPSRYVQWSCSTPTMIFTLSRISNMDPKDVAIAMAADWLMVVTGYLASETPWWLGIWFLAISFLCMAFVLKQLQVMLNDALREANTEHSKRCLRFTLYSTLVIWSLFPIGWVASHITAIPVIALLGEPIHIFANFSAKVVFSTSIMYNNFVTLEERRRAVRIAAEHKERIQAVHDLTDAVGRKDAFLEVVAHELRTPLNAICQLSAALGVGAGGPLATQAKEWIGTIKASAAHLLGVVNDILTFRAGQVTGLVVKQELVNVADVVDEVMRTLLPSAGQGITLEKVIHARLPLIVADRRRLVLALTNLVANSIKFMDKTTGKVTVKAYPDRGARNVIIKVTDSGPGLSAKQLAQLGDAGLGTVDAGKRRAGGLGLGLPITFQLVHAHGGVLRITSPGMGMGVTALVRLPVLQAITDASLQQQFVSTYSAMGYNLEQLLSPELAASEGRACPVFTTIVRPPVPPTQNASLNIMSTSASSIFPQQQAALPPPVPQAPQAPQPISYVHNAPQLRTHISTASSSASSSFDLGTNVQTYHWHAPNMDGSGLANPFGGQSQGNAADVDQHPSRPSEDSLAAWEAYAENMGYTLPSNTGMDSARASQASVSLSAGQFHGTACPTPMLNPSLSGAASAKGVPGQAVALMSSLFSPAAAVPPAGAARKARMSSIPKGARSSCSSARMSIEEGDEEGQEDEDVVPSKGTKYHQTLDSTVPQRASVEVIGTPTRGSGNNCGPARYSEDASQALFESAAMATALASSMTSGSHVQDLSDKAGSGPLYVEAPDWDAYLQTGDDDAGSVCRQESEAVVAANARLSIQYQAAVAEAARTGGQVDAKWQTWVSRIPEHHKAAFGVATPPA